MGDDGQRPKSEECRDPQLLPCANVREMFNQWFGNLIVQHIALFVYFPLGLMMIDG